MEFLIVEDQEIMLKGIKTVFMEEWPDVNFHFATNGKEALEMVKSNQFDVMMTDLTMPEMGGVELITRIRKLEIDIKIIVYTVHSNLFNVRSCIDAKVDAYLTKNDGFRDIKKALELIQQGKTFFSPRVKHHVEVSTIKAFNLTSMQLNIAILLSKGLSAKDIAEIYDSAEETVKTHRKRIYKALDINHITDLTRWVSDMEIEYGSWND